MNERKFSESRVPATSCEARPADVPDHATNEITSGGKLGLDATKTIPGEGFKRPWPPLIKMDAVESAEAQARTHELRS